MINWGQSFDCEALRHHHKLSCFTNTHARAHTHTLTSSPVSVWVHALPACQQANEQQCLVNGLVVQHVPLLIWCLIPGTEEPFSNRLIAFCKSPFSSLSLCAAYRLAVTITAQHVSTTGSSHGVRKWTSMTMLLLNRSFCTTSFKTGSRCFQPNGENVQQFAPFIHSVGPLLPFTCRK